MARLRIHNFSVSIDGYGAGPNQSLENPLGEGGLRLHEWVFGTPTFQRSHGVAGPENATDIDEHFAAIADENIGATIMGRNMFSPVRGPWHGDAWKGWWGENPPFHHPVFVLTHYPRETLSMEGGTTFHFVTGGIREAHERAFEAAAGKDVRLGGGVATIQECLRAGLVDEMHLAIVPVFLGCGERLFDHLDGGPAGLACAEFIASESVLHVRFQRA